MTPPPAIARFQAVTSIDCATSADSPAVLASAVWNSVGAPPNARPHAATAVVTTAGSLPLMPRTNADNANSTVLASVIARRWLSMRTPMTQSPINDDRPNTSNITSVRSSMPRAARNGAM